MSDEKDKKEAMPKNVTKGLFGTPEHVEETDPEGLAQAVSQLEERLAENTVKSYPLHVYMPSDVLEVIYEKAKGKRKVFPPGVYRVGSGVIEQVDCASFLTEDEEEIE